MIVYLNYKGKVYAPVLHDDYQMNLMDSEGSGSRNGSPTPSNMDDENYIHRPEESIF